MKSADDDWVKNRQYEIDTYGNDFDKIYEAYENGKIDGVHQGYEKVKFTINMPNGEQYTFRYDIGDGDGGVIDFIKQYGDKYKDIVSELERAKNRNVYNEDFVEIQTQSYKYDILPNL